MSPPFQNHFPSLWPSMPLHCSYTLVFISLFLFQPYLKLHCPASLGTIFSSSYSIHPVAMETRRLTVRKGLLLLHESQHVISPAPGTRVLETACCTSGYSQFGPTPTPVPADLMPSSSPSLGIYQPSLKTCITGSPVYRRLCPIHLLPAMISTPTLDFHTFSSSTPQ